MITRFYRRLQSIHPELPKFLAALFLMAVCGGIFEATYNPYLYAQFHISPQVRGNLEFVREFPGLMNAPLMGALARWPESVVAAFSALVTALGTGGLGLWGSNWWLMLVCTILWGVGSHLIMPIRSSLTMALGGQTKRARRLGQVSAVQIVGSILGSAIVWVVFDYLGRGRPDPVDGMIGPVDRWQYDVTFYAAAVACLGAAVFFALLRDIGSHAGRPPFVLKRRYWLYYALNVLYGGRKQVFLTFGRWVLVTVFHQRASTFARLSIVASTISIPFNQYLGRLVDRFGERDVLVVDSFLLMLVCLGYGGARHLGLSDTAALWIVCASYVGDQVFFGLGMARDTYMSKIAETPSDLTASLSVGVTIDHLISVSVPTLGGMLWLRHGYEAVFMAAAVMAVFMTIFSAMVKAPRSVDLEEA